MNKNIFLNLKEQFLLLVNKWSVDEGLLYICSVLVRREETGYTTMLDKLSIAGTRQDWVPASCSLA